VSFDALADAGERAFLHEQPTTFRLSDDAVDRLRRAGGRVLRESPEFRRLLRDVGATIVPAESPPG
jgi:NTE family protein